MPVLTYDNVVEALIGRFPELGGAYGKWLDSWKGERPGQYNSWGELVSPYFRDLLKSKRDPNTLKRIFEFFEEMAGSDDVHVVNLLQVEELEFLTAKPELLAYAWEFMGEKTKALTRETAKLWKCERNLPPAGTA
jgi:hypothetical protein